MVLSSEWTADDNRELARRLRQISKNMLGLGAFLTVVLVLFTLSRPFIFTLGSVIGLGGSFLLVFFKEKLGLPAAAGMPERNERVDRHFAEARTLRQRWWLLAFNLPLLALLVCAAAVFSESAPIESDFMGNLIVAIVFAFVPGMGINGGLILLSIERALRRQYPEQFQALAGH